MSKEDEINLLMDLAKLFRKYEPQVFSDLLTTLSNPDLRNKLILIASRVLDERNVRNLKRRSGSHRFEQRHLAAEINEPDPRKRQLLKDLSHLLSNTSVFRSLSDIKLFLTSIGMEDRNLRSRRFAVDFAVSGMREFPLKKLENIKETLERQRTAGGDLQKWANIIMGEDNENESQNRNNNE